MDYLKLTKSLFEASCQRGNLGGKSLIATCWNRGSLGKEVIKGK
jgi:hypothetical protein